MSDQPIKAQKGDSMTEEKPYRGVMIKDGKHSNIAEGDFAELIGAEDVVTPALRIGAEWYGCACSKKNLNKNGIFSNCSLNRNVKLLSLIIAFYPLLVIVVLHFPILPFNI